MASSTQDVNSNFEMSLRDQLMAAQTSQQQDPQQQHQGPDDTSHSSIQNPYQQDPRQTQIPDGQIDPSIGGPDHQGQGSPPDYDMGAMVMNPDLDDMNGNQQKGGGRRELSTTKRAAQNRAAQRAFRQRKEAYITKLEKQVKDYRAMEEDFKGIQHENYQLREYIISLQNRILETSSELPPPPSRVHLGDPTDPSRPLPPPPSHQEDHHPHMEIDPNVRDDHSGIPHPSASGAPSDLSPPQSHHQQHHDPALDQSLSDTQHQAPIASMTAHSDSAVHDGIPAGAVEQLQAAAAEAGELDHVRTKAES